MKKKPDTRRFNEALDDAPFPRARKPTTRIIYKTVGGKVVKTEKKLIC